MKRDDIYYKAMLARDHRFDGKFFIGVKTTGIYCRPICPARPKRENVVFFANHLEAEKEGFRPCMRCRPESAPRSPAWIGTSAIVQRAVKVLHRDETLEFNEDKFAALFGVSARHLRRLFIAEIGKTPKQLSFENRLNLARKLLFETALSISEIAHAAGFQSIRRFNDAFKDRFKKNPSAVRRSKKAASSPMVISLSYRPPLDFQALLTTYRTHQIGSLERFEKEKMHRIVEFDGKVGEIAISNDVEKSALIVEIDFPDTSFIRSIIARVRTMFDLDSDPVIVANALEIDPAVKKILRRHRGLRLPSGWDPFEIAIGAILGQLVSVDFGRALVADLIEYVGHETIFKGKRIKLFPSAKAIAASDLKGIRTTTTRKQTLRLFSEAVLSGTLSLEPTQSVDEFLEAVLAIRGIGPWTAHYMALKVLRHTDAFPASDLILARALELHPQQIVDQMSPWRGYAAALFWREYTHTLKKKGRPK